VGHDFHSLLKVVLSAFELLDVQVCLQVLKVARSSDLLFKTTCSFVLPSLVQDVVPFASGGVHRWKGLGQVPAIPLCQEEVLSAFQFGCAAKCATGVCYPKIMKVSGEYVKMLDDLAKVGIIRQLEGDLGPTFNLFLRPKPHSDKLLLLCDCRDIIRHVDVAAVRYVLLKVTSLFHFQPQWFCKVDVSNAYQSLLLPIDWQRLFRLSCFVPGRGEVTFCWCRLPFGWDKSPGIFQGLMSRLLAGVGAFVDVLCLMYLDDVLVCGRVKDAVRLVTAQVLQRLQVRGFVPSWGKVVREPVQKIEWLGREIQFVGGELVIRSVVQVVAAVVAGVAVVAAKPGPARLARQVAGLIAFGSMHSKFALPFAQYLHRVHVTNAARYPSCALHHLALAAK